MYEFKKKNGKYSFSTGCYKIEFSKPSIQQYDSEYEIITDEKQIMYYYYTLKIFMIKKDKKEKLLECNPYDFPCIQQMKWILNYVMNAQPDETWQTIRYKGGEEAKSLFMDTEGFVCQDYMAVTKLVRDGKEFYDVCIGGDSGFDSNEHLCVHMHYLTREELNGLYQCICEFIQYSIEITNEATKKYTELCEQDKITDEGRLVVFKQKKNKVTDKYDAIIMPGQKLDICVIRQYQDGEPIFIDMDNCKLIEVNDGEVILEKNDVKCKVALKDLLYISAELDEKRLKYNLDEIADDFFQILTDKEKTCLKNTFISVLLPRTASMQGNYKIFKDAIINRSAMCRNEHPYLTGKEGYEEVEKYYAWAVFEMLVKRAKVWKTVI